MCLQWCHVHHYLIDNDDPCSHCSLSEHLLPQQRCTTCTHRIERDQRDAICGLTHMALPQRGGCCHANVVLDRPPGGIIWLTSDSLAPNLITTRGTADIAKIFKDSLTAPEYAIDNNGLIAVQLEQLAIPEIYGVPADEWYAALGRTPPVYTWPTTSEPAESTIILPIIDDICHYLEQPYRNELTHASLIARIQALPTLSATWEPVIADALQALETL